MLITSTRKATPPPAAAPTSTTTTLPTLLDQITARVTQLGAEFRVDRQKFQKLSQRLTEERFHLAVLGQFKRGKSTLLNALLGEALLPTSVVPLTAIPTFLHSGSHRQARVIYQDGQPVETCCDQNTDELTAFLTKFVTEAGNPNNQRGVSNVEVFHPAALLGQGVVMIDTPGIGSTLRHNTEATLNFLPQCDAALFLVSADPPITEVEVEFLKEVRSRVAHLFFILNKVDYLSNEERQAALCFFRNVLQDQVGIEGEPLVFCISARQGLRARQIGNSSLWQQSGLGEVENHLLKFLVSDKTEVLQTALARKADDLIADILMRLQLTIRSLQLPLATLEERQQRFAQKLAEAEHQRLIAADLLAGDQKRLVTFLEEQAEQLRQKARRYLEQIVNKAVMGANLADEQAVQDLIAEAIPGFFEHELGLLARTFEQQVAEVLRPHRQRADGLIETVRESAAELFEIPYRPFSQSNIFTLSQQPYWVTHHWQASLSPISPRLIDRLLPLRVRRSRISKRLMAQIERLVMHNVENLRWTTLQSLNQTFRRFNSTLAERLQENITATRGAIQAAYTKRQKQAEVVAETVTQLEASMAALEQLQVELQILSARSK